MTTADHTPALQVRGLTKRFDRLAVDALDLTVRPGEFYALLGPNGAGKTSLLRGALGLVVLSAGSASLQGDAPHRLSARARALPRRRGRRERPVHWSRAMC